MTPAYSIGEGGVDVTGNFNGRMITMTVVEKVGGEGDTLDIDLDDRDGSIAIPPKGSTLSISMGFLETGIASLGNYVVESVTLDWSPARIMKIHGTSAALGANSSLKGHQTQNYENMTLSDIAAQVAGRSGLTPNVIGDFGSSKFTMLHQADESDMNMLNRIGRDHGAIFKVAGGQLIMSALGSAITGNNVTVTPGMVKVARVHLPDRSAFGNTVAYSYDKTTAQRVPATGGGGGVGVAAFVLKHNLLDAPKAQLAADARANELNLAKADAHVELAYGDATITASGGLTLVNFRDGMDGTYTINTVEHNIDSDGYTTKIDADNGESDSNPGVAGGADDSGQAPAADGTATNPNPALIDPSTPDENVQFAQ